jgi:hypothetical protein
MITATFTNGHTDTYKGLRDVKAAWALINKKSGVVVASGHSLTAKAAESTGKSAKHLPHFDMKWSKTWGVKEGMYTKADIKRMEQENRDFRLAHEVKIISL